MRDKIIINIISKTYTSIVSLLVFILLLLFIGFIILQNGLFLNEVTVSNVHIKQLYIKWNEKLDVSIHEIKISNKKINTNTNIDYKKLSSSLQKLSHTSPWFNSLTIEKILYKEITASFKYASKDKGFFLASSKDIDLDVSIGVVNDILTLNIKKFYDKKRDITLYGNIYIDTKNTLLLSNVNLNVSKELDLTLYLQSDTKKLYYRLVSNKLIRDYKHAIALANLPKEGQYWAYDVIKMSSVNITNANGFVDYDKMDEILTNIKVSATVDKLEYTYNKDLDPIHTKETQLEFKDGLLYIYPHQAFTSGKYLGQSWLKLDFTKTEELLSIKLIFNSILDKDMLNILNTYKIKLPFLQKKGVVKTDLNLEIGLRELHVKARGSFFTKEANFDYLGLNIDIYDANILLDNYDINIKKMKAKYKNIAKADVDVKYNASTSEGEIGFDFNYIKTQGLSLNTNSSPLHVKYNIGKTEDSIDVDSSLWHFKKQNIKIDTMHIPFNLKELKLQIPTTFIEDIDIGSAFISGSVNLSTIKAELNVDVLKFNYEGIEFSQSNTPFKIFYDKKFSIYSKNEIFFKVSGSNYRATNFYLELNENNILLKHTKLNIGKYITTKIYANFNTKTNKSHISLSNFVLIDPNTQNILYKNKKIMLSLSHLDGLLKISSRELDGEFLSRDKGWKLQLNSLNPIAKNSTLLKKLHLENGDFTLYKNKNDKYTRFKSNVVYPYKILVKDNIPLEAYKIKGKIYKERVYIAINNKIHIEIKDSVNINMDNSVLNISELLRVLKDIPSNTDKSNTLNILLKATNSTLYVNKSRSILYHTLDLQLYDNILTAQLSYSKGKAGLRFENNKFHLYGKNFNDKFMNELFSLSKFTKGNLDFSLSGNTDDYNGVIYVKKTTIRDYKTLNNILAFVNTVPSLVTFQLPGYSNEGLFIDKAYIKFKYNDNVFHLSDIYLDSKEIDILGKGVADFDKDTIDIVLNLKTDLGSDLAKVPLVGYILLDGDTISTTLSIKGKASDPKIKSLIAEDIVVAPFNIIKRTLSLPYLLIKDAVDKK
ncbi:AsmA-like C-terminal domain-containing protein [Sulfurimonas sp. SAG-AH-194-L11]|nr:AsmA-like C-terminal domain-containing protein [Sulfurimonas sp. SAG-AH-194-L11]MDF1876889.1 AsmA-like C-terminal domain-containing protein [Sulfurimonas sp. SAG-AH-194-L11]